MEVVVMARLHSLWEHRKAVKWTLLGVGAASLVTSMVFIVIVADGVKGRRVWCAYYDVRLISGSGVSRNVRIPRKALVTALRTWRFSKSSHGCLLSQTQQFMLDIPGLVRHNDERRQRAGPTVYLAGRSYEEVAPRWSHNVPGKSNFDLRLRG
jgi:hypothetical protein